MSTATDERVDVILDVDLDAVVPCNYLEEPDAPCANEAEWVYTCPSCRYAWIHCSPHRSRSDEVEAKIPEDYELCCKSCDGVLPVPAPWRHL